MESLVNWVADCLCLYSAVVHIGRTALVGNRLAHNSYSDVSYRNHDEDLGQRPGDL